MERKDKQKTGKVSYILTRETLGMTILLFSAIVLVMLFTRGSVFAGIGEAVCTFMFGSFGYGAILMVALLAYFGEWLVFEKKLTIKPVYTLVAIAAVTTLFMLFHSVTTRNFAMDSYGTYLSDCYFNASTGWSGYTFGGAVSGLIVYPVAKLTTFIGAYIIFSLLFLLCGYAGFILFKRNYVSPSKLPVAKVTEEEQVDSARQVEMKSSDHLYTVDGDQKIVDNRPKQVPEMEIPVTARPIEAEEQQPVQTEPDDRYSQANLGRKILFENGEFAAESYRRNMIFSEESYFNNSSAHVTSDSDYLSSFSSGKKPSQGSMTYTQSYEQSVSQEQSADRPLNYIYGDKPVEDLSGDYTESNTYRAEESSDYHTETEPQETEESFYEESNEEPVTEEQTFVPDRREPAEERNVFDESRPLAEESEPEPVPEEKTDKPRSIISSLFGTDTGRRESRREERNPIRDDNDGDGSLFDDNDEFGEDVFGIPRREERTPVQDRRDTPAESRFERDEPPIRRERTEEQKIQSEESSTKQPEGLMPRERNVGFTLPVSDRRGAASKPVEQQPEEKPEEKPKHVWKKYVRPGLDLLDDYPENNNINTGEIEDSKRAIVETLEKFKISGEVANVTIGPAITRYDVIIADRTNIKRSLNYRDEIALALMKNNVNAYMNYPKGAISIEVPNTRRAVVGLKSMLVSPQFINSKPNSLTFGLGKNIEGEVVCPDITKMPHLLVAGTTGSGKSICLSTLLISLLYKYGPEELRLILVDPKQAEFISFNKLPHLMINEILYEIDKVIKALNWAIAEMERRYALFKEMTERGMATKDLDEYNAHLPEGEEKLPKILIVLDEFGDLMIQAKKDIEGRIVRLVQKARACGIHLILATQRPSVNCITGLIKSNLPTRIGFKVGSFDDSRTIFDIGGAEKLLGKGDMYYRSPENTDLARIQGCFISSGEVQKVTDFVKANNETYFDQSVSDFINKVEEPEPAVSAGGGDMLDDGDAKMDDTFLKALKYCITSNQASVSMIQRRFPIGYIKACKIIDWMEKMNYITQSEGSKPRKILLTAEEFAEKYGDVDE